MWQAVIDPEPPASRLHLVFQQSSEDLFEPDYAANPPIIRLTAFRHRQRVFGWLPLRVNRLTDLLNAHAELHLRDVEIEDFGTGLTEAADEVLIARRDLIAVAAGEPRGDPTLRHETRTHPVAVQSGDFLVGGYLHVLPGADPVAGFRDRPVMVPLTYAWIEHWSGDRRSTQSIGTIVVNRDMVDWMRVVSDEDLISGQLRPVRPVLSVGEAQEAAFGGFGAGGARAANCDVRSRQHRRMSPATVAP